MDEDAPYRLEFFDGASRFLAAAGDWLADRPVESTVVATVAHRLQHAGDGPDPAAGVPRWWLVVRSAGGQVVGAGMRTAPFAPHPPYLLSMPDAAAVRLAELLYSRGERVGGVNGALPAVERFAATYAGLTGAELEQPGVFLDELGELVVPASPPGSLRLAGAGDLELATSWFRRFRADADEQAGRPRPSAEEWPNPTDVARRIAQQMVWWWCDPSGSPVHLTGANPPSFGVARIGQVFTPPEHRGRGYATW
jgi:predicted GNAT family acetyltransferase